MLQLVISDPGRRDTRAYRAFTREVRAERPICEHCNSAQSKIVAHIEQPWLGGALIDKSNVLALCAQCDRDYTRSNPPLRRRKKRKD